MISLKKGKDTFFSNVCGTFKTQREKGHLIGCKKCLNFLKVELIGFTH